MIGSPPEGAITPIWPLQSEIRPAVGARNVARFKPVVYHAQFWTVVLKQGGKGERLITTQAGLVAAASFRI